MLELSFPANNAGLLESLEYYLDDSVFEEMET